MIQSIINNVGATAIAVALIALVGALGGTLVSFAISRRTVYINSVTAERSKWIDKLRSNLAEYISLVAEYRWKVEHLRLEMDDDQVQDALHRIGGLSAIIKLQLNPDGQVDKNVIRLLGTTYILMPYGKSETLHIAQSLFIAHSQWLLKDEWEVVKYEALGLLGRRAALKKRRIRESEYRAYARSEGLIGPVEEISKRIVEENLAERDLAGP